MKIENVKAVFKDINQMYLVGLSSYPSPVKTYSLLGGHSEKGETPFETLGREILEESSMVLEFSYDETKGFYLFDPKREIRIPLVFKGISVVDKKWYVFFDILETLDRYMHLWEVQFQKNQKSIIDRAVESLKEVYPNIQWHKAIDLFRNRKFAELRDYLNTMTKSEFKNIIKFMKDHSYYLENSNLVLVDRKDLENHIYEKDVIQYL